MEPLGVERNWELGELPVGVRHAFCFAEKFLAFSRIRWLAVLVLLAMISRFLIRLFRANILKLVAFYLYHPSSFDHSAFVFAVSRLVLFENNFLLI